MNQALLDRVLRSPRLPTLPAIAVEVIDLVKDPDVTIRKIAETIQNDPALAGKVLKTVNSSFYGQSKAISSIQQALVVLGLRSVKTLALGFTLVTNLEVDADNTPDGFDHMGFWKRSLFSASAAKKLADEVKLGEPEEVFLAALMQDLGMVALSQTLGAEYEPVLRSAGPKHRALARHEREAFEMDHAQLGAELAKTWGLPEVLIEPIRWHENPDGAPAETRDLARILAVSNRVAEIYDDPEDAQAIEDYYRCLQGWFNLGREVAEPVLASIHAPAGQMKRLFELPAGEFGDAEAILAKANEVLETLSLQGQHEAEQLKREKQALAAEVRTDSLTGVANRRRFNEYLTERFVEALKRRTPLALLFLDADHFKAFNDVHGHATGDRVLIEIGKVLRDQFQVPDLPCRYGGEEFAVIMPGTDRRTASLAAERLRNSIEQAAVPSCTGEPLHVTASIGVAAYEGAVFRRPEQLVKAADQAAYAAKSAGRNCVRVFTPKVPKAA
ncbi:MAG: GGDEF domain-containing protein [Planctomycetota bacterium]